MKQLFKDDGSIINMDKVEFLSDKGSEFRVYKYLEWVLKIYKEDYPLTHLSLEELNVLKNILTKRILLPTSTLWSSKQELVGYMMPYILGEKEIGNDSVRTLFDELETIREDINLLCSKSVILRDINLSNTIYNGHLYLIDPGNYLVDGLEHIIFRLHTTNLEIEKELRRMIQTDDYSKIKELVNLLTEEERQSLLREWNYDKLNKLIDMLLFSRREDISPYKYRQIVQFIIQKRLENNVIYSLDILKILFNPELTIKEAIDEFIKRYIDNTPKEKSYFYSL